MSDTPTKQALNDPRLTFICERVLIPALQQWYRSQVMAKDAKEALEALGFSDVLREACNNAGTAPDARYAELGHLYVPVQVNGEQMEMTVPVINADNITIETIYAYVERNHPALATEFEDGDPTKPLNGKPRLFLTQALRQLRSI